MRVLCRWSRFIKLFDKAAVCMGNFLRSLTLEILCQCGLANTIEHILSIQLANRIHPLLGCNNRSNTVFYDRCVAGVGRDRFFAPQSLVILESREPMKGVEGIGEGRRREVRFRHPVE